MLPPDPASAGPGLPVGPRRGPVLIQFCGERGPAFGNGTYRGGKILPLGQGLTNEDRAGGHRIRKSMDAAPQTAAGPSSCTRQIALASSTATGCF